MIINVLEGILLPLLGTSLGAACVFFLRGEMRLRVRKMLTGFASGIMVSASFFSLILPALEQENSLGRWAFVPAAAGFLLGMFFLLLLDLIVPHIHLDQSEEGPKSGLRRTTKLILAVTIHNIPEGMAVGVVFAGWLYGRSEISLTSALVLSLGIAIQNFPEGAIVSMPLLAEGMPKPKTFLYGVLSGAVEPVGALLTILAAGFFLPVMPYFLSFAAGAMFYVVVEELIPEMSEGTHMNIGTVSFAIGFVLMMALDVGLG
ncbi:MAG: ZIP family metal transporter [Oscillospiraceae bacterium]|nr:ZIP family metal transporter [Oscillospiraceae bacterium]